MIFRHQGIEVLWRLQFLIGYWTLSLNFRRLRLRLKLSWLCSVRAFWNLKLKVLKYSKNCSLHNILIPWSLKNPESPNKDVWTRNGFVPQLNWIWWICSILLTCNKRKRKMNGKYDRKKTSSPIHSMHKKILGKVVYFSSGGFPWFSPYTLTQNSFYRRTLTLMSFIFMK